MNSFQILNKHGNPIPINVLDCEAANFWNVEIHPKQYAHPKDSRGNWFDMIGFNIAHQGHYTNGWNNVKLAIIHTECEHYANLIINGQNHNVSFKDIINGYKPYFDLIDHWSSLGYTPKQIKD